MQDLGSMNGTFVNGQPASVPTPLHDGDELRLGPMSFRVGVVDGRDSGTLLIGSIPSEVPAH